MKALVKMRQTEQHSKRLRLIFCLEYRMMGIDMKKLIWWLTLIFASVNILLIPIGGGFNLGCAVIGFLVCAVTGRAIYEPIEHVFCNRCMAKFPKTSSPGTAGYYD